MNEHRERRDEIRKKNKLHSSRAVRPEEIEWLLDQLESAEKDRERLAVVRIGKSALTRDLVWCECKRGLSLTGKWTYCPNCGRKIDQESYEGACEQAIKNGGRLYAGMEYDTKLLAAEADRERLLQACMEAKKYLEPDLVEPGRTVFWRLVDSINTAKAQEGHDGE